MIWLSNSTLARLRDQLRSRGQRPSVVAPAPHASPEEVELLNVMTEYGPLCEAMYLMMSADGEISGQEREVLKGALRNLSSDGIRSVHIDAMLDLAKNNVTSQGRSERLKDVAAELREDTGRAEVAFMLAAAMAFADNAISDEENETLNDFAELLGIDETRANALLDQAEADLNEAAKAAS